MRSRSRRWNLEQVAQDYCRQSVDGGLDGVDKWYRGRARGINNFVRRAWIGRPPKRCRNQREHPVVIIHHYKVYIGARC